MSMTGERGVICQQARIERMQDGRATVLIQPRSACGACAEGRGCGFGLLDGLLRKGPVRFEVAADERLKPGDRVAVEADSRLVTRLALRAYGGPLLAFLAVVAVSARLLPAGPAADLGGLALGLAALVASAWYLGRMASPPSIDRELVVRARDENLETGS